MTFHVFRNGESIATAKTRSTAMQIAASAAIDTFRGAKRAVVSVVDAGKRGLSPSASPAPDVTRRTAGTWEPQADTQAPPCPPIQERRK